MKINGKIKDIDKSISVSELLESEGYGSERVAVELDGAIIPRSEYGTAVVTNGSVVEVVRFVGGG